MKNRLINLSNVFSYLFNIIGIYFLLGIIGLLIPFPFISVLQAACSLPGLLVIVMIIYLRRASKKKKGNGD